MIPAEFGYLRAASVEEALTVLAETPESKVLAGGHSLVPLMKLRLSLPSVLVDVGRLAELRYIRDEGEYVAIGALTPHDDVARSEILSRRVPLLAQTARHVGDPQVRHRGTIGGSAAHGDAAADLPAALVALDASFVIEGRDGRRLVDARDFFRGVLTTAVHRDELLREIRVPAHSAGSNGAVYVKFNRRAQDWATVGVAVDATVRDGMVVRVAVGLTNMGATPLRAVAVEQALTGATADPERISQAAALAADGTTPPSDRSASAEFRRHLCRVLTGRAVEQAINAARRTA